MCDPTASETAPPANPTFKVVFLGDEACGKSSFLSSIMLGLFPAEHEPTLGVDFADKTVYVPEGVATMKIWDTSGHTRYRLLLSSYLQSAHAAVIMFDRTSSSGLESVSSLYRELLESVAADIPVLVVGCKSDASSCQVSHVQAHATCRALGLRYAPASAQEPEMCAEIMRSVTSALLTDARLDVLPLDEYAVDMDAETHQDDITSDKDNAALLPAICVPAFLLLSLLMSWLFPAEKSSSSRRAESPRRASVIEKSLGTSGVYSLESDSVFELEPPLDCVVVAV